LCHETPADGVGLALASLRIDRSAGIVADEGRGYFAFGLQIVEGQFLSFLDTIEGIYVAPLEAEIGSKGVIEIERISVLHMLPRSYLDTLTGTGFGSLALNGVNQLSRVKGEAGIGRTLTMFIFTYLEAVAAIAHEERGKHRRLTMARVMPGEIMPDATPDCKGLWKADGILS
jgi:hypothetical protein